MRSPFPCSPVIREWSWQKTQIEKRKPLFKLTVVSISSVWVEMLKMFFVYAGKTDFVRFWDIPNATVSKLWFVKDFEIFSGRGDIQKLFLFIFLLICFFFLFLYFLQLLPYELWRAAFHPLSRKQDRLINSISRLPIRSLPYPQFLTISAA